LEPVSIYDYVDVLSVVPPVGRSLHVDSIGLHLFQQQTGAMSEGSGGVSCSNEVKGALIGWVLKCDQCVVEGIEAVGYSIMNVAV
jgi:hypothetical protein